MQPRKSENIEPEKKEKNISAKLKLSDDKEIRVKLDIAKEKLDNMILSFAFSMRKGFASNTPYGKESDHVQVLVKMAKPLKPKLKECKLIVPDTLDSLNFDAYLVESEVKRNKNPNSIKWEISDINKPKILSDAEIIQLFKTLASHFIYKDKLQEEKMDDELLVDVLSEMIRQPAKEAGEKYIQEIKPIWDQLKENEKDEKVRIVEWDQVISEIPDFNEKYRKLKEQYDTNAKFKKAIDKENEDVAQNKKYKEAGERLKGIIENPSYAEEFKHEALKKLTLALCKADFNRLGMIAGKRYRLIEIVQMMDASGKEYIGYRGRLGSKALREFFRQNKIPLIEIEYLGKDKTLEHSNIPVSPKAPRDVVAQDKKEGPLKNEEKKSESKSFEALSILVPANNKKEPIFIESPFEQKDEHNQKEDNQSSHISAKPVRSTAGIAVLLQHTPKTPLVREPKNVDQGSPSFRKQELPSLANASQILHFSFLPVTPTTLGIIQEVALSMSATVTKLIGMQARGEVSMEEVGKVNEELMKWYEKLAALEDKNKEYHQDPAATRRGAVRC